TASGDSKNLHGVVRYLMGEWQTEPGNGDGIHIHDSPDGIENFKNFTRGVQFRVLFLLIHGHKGTIGYANNYTSQSEVRELATEFDVDYFLIDAEVRFELCTKKHKEIHRIYLD